MKVVAAHRLGQSDLPRQAAGVGHLGAVEGDEPALLCPVAVGVVIDADNDHLVVGEQVTFDCFGEPQPVKHRPERFLVVHRGDLEVGLLGFPQYPPGEVARGGSHEQAATRQNLFRINDLRKVRRNAPGTAMSLIGDGQVERRNPAQSK
ncbi:MAG: hypothetical protein ACXVX4_11755 [Mycobacterium sp.]